ncbi:hypothetical protein HRJ34_21220 [Rhizorhabdus wittichii]|uniref:Uncharacterized protein n=1 Tax=Rhizorhabdus wittichii TaxID=160791 RepID=A0A975HD16_9SPHN|nr:hypothetical protein [Rhizorhabdus wittichii]QTH20818.1 hypothetical protein HRJ34_21220 [Rhizorhabdus wittichii]
MAERAGHPRQIGEILAPVIAHTMVLAWFQAQIDRQPTSMARKHLVMLYRECGAIDDGEALILVEANMLETA